jgi:hypothetical protein
VGSDNITVDGTTNSLDTTDRGLTLSAGGSGAITLTGLVGDTFNLGQLTLQGNGTYTLTAGVTDATGLDANNNTGTLRLDGNVTLSDGNGFFAHNLTLGGNVIVDTSAGNDVITVDGTTNSVSATDRNLTLTAGNAAITLTGQVGNTFNLGQLTLVSTGTSTLTAGVTAAMGLDANNAAGTLRLDDNVTLSNGNGFVANDLVLGGNVIVDTSADNDSITVDGTTDSFDATARDLTLTAGTGNVTFSGAVGGTNELASLTVTDSNDISIGNTVDAGTIDLTAQNDVTFVSNVAGDQDITATTGDLTINAGVLLTLEDAVGQRTRLVTTSGDIFLNVSDLVIQNNDTDAQINAANNLVITAENDGDCFQY